MNTSDILDTRRQIEQAVRSNYPNADMVSDLTRATTVAVSREFAQYVAAMADAWPPAEDITWPTMDEARWPFPDQSVIFVFEEPIFLEFLVVDHQDVDGQFHKYPRAIHDEEPVIGLVVLDSSRTLITIQIEETGESHTGLKLLPTRETPQRNLFVHPLNEWEPGLMAAEVTTGKMAWGVKVHRNPDEPMVGYCARWERSFAEAIAHRLASIDEPDLGSMPRPARRAIQRQKAPFRVLRLRTPMRASERSGNGKPVPWTKRWWTRGHWRNQPYGPRANPSYRLTWIDPFIKGPDDLPLDDRPDLFRLD